MPRHLKWKVSVISTDFDLHDLRNEVERFLDDVGFSVVAFETPDFPVYPGVDAHKACILALQSSDIVILIIDKIYGSLYRGKGIESITMREFLEAKAWGKILIPCVRAKTFQAAKDFYSAVDQLVEKKRLSLDEARKEIKPDYVDSWQVLEFVNRVREAQEDNFMILFDSGVDLIERLRGRLCGLTRYICHRIINEQKKSVRNIRTIGGVALSLGDVLEKGYIVDRGFNPQDDIELVIQLDGCRSHLVLDTDREVLNTGDIDFVELYNSGTTTVNLLNWRLEWPALWKLLRVDIEAFGKDHATPGGSRDSCKEIARELMDMLPPFGIPYEWVGIRSEGKDMGDMSSSGFIGFTPKRWLEIGEPEVMRYVYMFNTTSKRIMFDLSRVDTYHDHYDEAERLFFQDEDDARARAYELSQIREPPSALPFRLPYRHASLLSQVGPSEKLTEWAVKRLRDTGVLA